MKFVSDADEMHPEENQYTINLFAFINKTKLFMISKKLCMQINMIQISTEFMYQLHPPSCFKMADI